MNQKTQSSIALAPKKVLSSQSYFLIGQGKFLVATQALNAPRFAATRFPLKQEDSPRHANALVVAGPVNRRYRQVVARLAAQLAWPFNVLRLEIVPVQVAVPLVKPTGPVSPSSNFLTPAKPEPHIQPAQIAITLHNFFNPSSPLLLNATKVQAESAPGTLVPLRSPQDKELATEDLTLSLGPAHPALYGPLRLVLTLDGEQVAAADADPGYAHRGLEKQAEGQEPLAALAIGADLDALAPLAGSTAVALALEKMWLGEKEKEPLPQRAGFLRLIALELERIASHLYAHSSLLKTVALDGPANKALDLYAEVTGSIELVCGDSPSPFIIPGGVQKDLNPESTSVLLRVMQQIQSWVRGEVGPPANSISNRLLRYTLKSRLGGQGLVGANEAAELGFTGPNLRASGHSFDGRSWNSLAETGLAYRELDFKPVFPRKSPGPGDAYSRLGQRINEIAASSGLIERALRNLPAGAIRLPLEPDQPFMLSRLTLKKGTLGPGEAVGTVESPRGLLEAHLTLTLAPEGRVVIERLHFRAPSWPHFAAVPDLITGARLPDALVIINSLDIAPDEAER